MSILGWDGRAHTRPEPLRPMEPHLRRRLVTADDYRYELKWDGIRLISWLGGHRVVAHTRGGRWCEEKYPELSALGRHLAARVAVVDGELVTLVGGRPCFRAMMVRHLRRAPSGPGPHRRPLLYVLFDLLFLDGRDLRAKPWQRRTALLEARLRAAPPVHYSRPRRDGAALLARVRAEGLEGVVAKRVAGRYRGGRQHDDWYKVKAETVEQFLICGYRPAGRAVRSLLLAAEDPSDGLRYVGSVGSGIDAAAARELFRLLTESPAGNPVAPGPERLAGVRWVMPRYRCRVRYLSRTRHGRLRQPVYLGLAEGVAW